MTTVGHQQQPEALADLTGRLHGVLDDLHELDGVDRRRAYAPDGHLSAKALVRNVGQLPGFEAHRRWQTVRMLRDLPAVAAAFASGEVGTAQVEELARTHANPRVRDLMPAAEELLLEDAQNSTFADFRVLLRAWRDYADQDGAADRARKAHDRRDYRMTEEFDGGWRSVGQSGTTQGSINADLHE